jgi:hypothetical protein
VSPAGKARGREGVSRAFIGGRDLEEGVGFRARGGDQRLWAQPCWRSPSQRRKMT